MSAITVREAAIVKARQICIDHGFQLYLSAHFSDRIAVRAVPNQSAAFTFFAACVKLVCSKTEYYGKRCSVKCDGHLFCLGVNLNTMRVELLSYAYNVEADRHFHDVDKKFELRRKDDAYAKGPNARRASRF